MWTRKKLLVIGGMLLLGCLAALVWFMNTRRKTLSQKERIINQCKKRGLTEAAAKVVAAISQHETANFKSKLATSRYNNFFGMNLPTTRETTAISGSESGFAVYESLEDSVDDFLLWWDMWGWKPNEDYVKTVTFMKAKRYFEDTLENYLKGVKSWL